MHLLKSVNKWIWTLSNFNLCISSLTWEMNDWLNDNFGNQLVVSQIWSITYNIRNNKSLGRTLSTIVQYSCALLVKDFLQRPQCPDFSLHEPWWHHYDHDHPYYFVRLDRAPPEPQTTLYNCFHKHSSPRCVTNRLTFMCEIGGLTL